MSKNLITPIAIAAVVCAILWMSPKQDASHASASASTAVENETPDLPDGLAMVESQVTQAKQPVPAKTKEVFLPSGSSVYNVLVDAGLAPKQVLDLIDAAKSERNLATIAAKTPITLAWYGEQDTFPTKISFKVSDRESLLVRYQTATSSWRAEMEKAEITTSISQFSGVVKSSLWDSAERAGMDATLINNMAAVFAWQVDFSRGVQPNDRWRLTVERVFADGEPIGWGNILAAEYENVGALVTAVRYAKDGVKGEYFQPDGNSLKRMFLKSPLRFGRITSRFNRNRFHPILKRTRPHLGVDYGAPSGTPVMAVGNGVVELVGRRGGSGNTVKIRHNSVYKTAYKHLSRYGKGIKPGAKVEMGDIIGYVGSTGLATGPHLHFEMYENNRYVDPLGIKFPSADPVPDDHKESFAQEAQMRLAQLPPWAEADIIESSVQIAKADSTAPDNTAMADDGFPDFAKGNFPGENDEPLEPTTTLR